MRQKVGVQSRTIKHFLMTIWYTIAMSVDIEKSVAQFSVNFSIRRPFETLTETLLTH